MLRITFPCSGVKCGKSEARANEESDEDGWVFTACGEADGGARTKAKVLFESDSIVGSKGGESRVSIWIIAQCRVGG